jgi:subtilisin family serine protease
MLRDKKARLGLTGAVIFLSTSCAVITGYASSSVSNPQVGRMKYVPGEILVKFRPGVPQAGIKAFNRAQHAQVLQELPRLKALRLKLPSGMDVNQAAELYGRNPDIEYAEPNYIYHAYAFPNDDMYSEQWALEKISMESAWDLEKGNTGVVIAIVDTGVQWDHPDLTGKIWENSDEIDSNGMDDDNNGYIDDIRGWDTADADNNYGKGLLLRRSAQKLLLMRRIMAHKLSVCPGADRLIPLRFDPLWNRPIPKGSCS